MLIKPATPKEASNFFRSFLSIKPPLKIGLMVLIKSIDISPWNDIFYHTVSALSTKPSGKHADLPPVRFIAIDLI